MEASLSLSPAPARMILAIDPGPERSAWIIWDSQLRVIHETGQAPNDEVLLAVRQRARQRGIWDNVGLLAIEMVASYGMAVGREVFETVLWTGRFIEAWQGDFRKVYRLDVKMHLCRNARAKDSNVRQALLDLFPRSGGGSTPQVGTKANPGPLYGISSHLWSALAVAVTAAETAA